ncbi:MAG: Crp/Fnr family transcriptional regulator [Deltaproteobacteria bacterium]|nr:Crp/Fnr family transcriptional regulator [Deltaproteobacteria bacterium]
MSFKRPVSQCTACILGQASSPNRCPWSPISRAAGATLTHEGEVADRLLFVREGLVSVEPSSGPASVRGPTSLLGAEALRGGTACARAVALTPVKLCTLSVDALKHWVGDALSPARAMMELSLDEQAASQSDRHDQSGKCLARVSRFLLERAASPPVKLTKTAIARMLHMRPETYSRSLRRLVERGLVDARAPHAPRDIPALQQLARGSES